MRTKTYANGWWNARCPKCGSPQSVGIKIGRHDIVRNRAGTRLGYTVERARTPGFFRPKKRKWAFCPHPFHDRKSDPMLQYRRPWRIDSTDVVTPATTINIRSKDDSKRKAKSRQDKTNQGKGRR